MDCVTWRGFLDPEWEQTVSFEHPDLYRRSPDSGELHYKSRELNLAV